MRDYLPAIAVLVLFGALAQADEKKTTDLTIPQLIKNLSDKDPDVRADAADELGKKGAVAKKAVPDLIAALKDPEETVRDAAVDALGQIGAAAKDAIPELAKALGDDKATVRELAAIALGQIGGEILKGVNPEDRHSTATEAGLIGQRSAAVGLLARLKDSDDAVREAAAHTLLKFSPLNKTAVNSLANALKDSHRGVRELIAECLCEMGPDAKAAIPALIDALAIEKDRHVRASIVEALGLIGEGTKEVVAALVKAKTDEAPVVRCAVAQSLGQLAAQPEIALPALIELMDNKDQEKGHPHIRHNAIEAIGSFGPQASVATANKAVPALVRTLNTAPPGHRFSAAVALGQFGPLAKVAIPDLEKASKEKGEPKSEDKKGKTDIAEAAKAALKRIQK